MPDRSRRVRFALFGLALAALLIAGAAFAYAIAQNRHTAASLAAEIRPTASWTPRQATTGANSTSL